MLRKPDFITARAYLADRMTPVETERVSLSEAAGRILAEDLIAADNIPPFDRSPFDGYAFRAADTAQASPEHPVTLTILEEVPAGAVPAKRVTPGTATKILTGAPIPEGADCVSMFERTEFTRETVTLFAPGSAGENIILAGEDVKKGTLLVRKGARIDAVGMQFHMFYPEREAEDKAAFYLNPKRIYDVLDTYARLNRPIQITEITIPAYSWGTEDEELQAEILENLYKIWFSHPAMEAIIYWNLVDGYAAWAPQGIC